jgi:hypothetical protein
VEAFGGPDTVERGYAEAIEAPAAQVHQKLLAGVAPVDLSVEERAAWAEFVATLEHRSPRSIQRVDAERETIVTDLLRRYRIEFGRDLPNDVDVDAMARSTVRSVVLTRRAELAEPLRRAVWGTVRVKGFELITADYPLAFFGSDEQRSAICLPLSPSVLWMAAGLPDGEWSHEVVRMLVVATNLQLIHQRPRWIYSRSRLEDGRFVRLLKAASDCLRRQDEPDDS